MGKRPEVKNWMHAQQSGVVLVEACGEKSQIGRLPPISYVCATLARVLQANPDDDTGTKTVANTALFFFCGQHTAPDDPLQGPQGLMRSLLAQLILTLVRNGWVCDSAPISVLSKQGYVGNGELEKFSLEDACQLFHQLLWSSVPRGASIFVLVDGINYFEHREGWRGHLEVVMDCFRAVVGDGSLGALFKLLLTSPTTATIDGLEAHQRVRLRAGSSEATERGLIRSLYS